MGGRLNLGYVRLTFVFKREVDEKKANEWLTLINEYLERDDELVEIFLDDFGSKDVDV